MGEKLSIVSSRASPACLARCPDTWRNSAAPLCPYHCGLMRLNFLPITALVLAAACASPLAWANDYSEVQRLLKSGQNAQAVAKAEAYVKAKPKDPQMRFLLARRSQRSGFRAWCMRHKINSFITLLIKRVSWAAHCLVKGTVFGLITNQATHRIRTRLVIGFMRSRQPLIRMG